MKLAIRPLAALLVLALAGCGGGSGDGATDGGGGPPATAPVITTQPVARSVTAPASATFSVVASGTAPLTYQWRSSGNGADWTLISGATGASYQTGTTDAAMDGRYFSVVVGNSAGSVTSASVRLTVAVTPAGPTGPSGEFPHTANPLAVAITPAAAAVAGFDVVSSTRADVQFDAGATDVALDNGVTVSIGLPGNAFLEDQSLAITPVTVAALDASHPLPFQTVLAGFMLGTADAGLPELKTLNALHIRFTLNSQALDALGGEPVMFSARADGTQLHLVPVFRNDDGSWSASTLTTSVDHLGIFGVASLSDQAATLAAAWPAFEDFQLEAAVAPPSYQWRKAGLAGQSKPRTSLTALMAKLLHAAAAPETDDGFAQMKARIDAYYNDQVAPAIAAANAANADLEQFRDASVKILSWERMRQLLGIADESDLAATNLLVDYTLRGLQVGLQECSSGPSVAATAQVLGLLRQAQLLGIQTDTTAQAVFETCGRARYDVSIAWSQAHHAEYDTRFDGDPANSRTTSYRSNVTLAGGLHLLDASYEVNSVQLDATSVYESVCAEGAYFCNYLKSTVTSHDTSPTVNQCGSGLYGGYSIDRWNLDARGHLATPLLSIRFQNPFGCAAASFIAATSQASQTDVDASGNSSTRTVNISDSVDTTPWSGTATTGSSTRIVRASRPVSIAYGSGTERWTTSLTFKVVELPNSR